MKKIIERGILLTYDEVKILLFGMGVREIDGIYMPEKQFTEEEVLRAMHHMSYSGMIVAEEKHFRIMPKLQKILNIMAWPEETATWILESNGASFFVYRKGDQYVVSTNGWRKKNTLMLTLFEEKEFLVWKEEHR